MELSMKVKIVPAEAIGDRGSSKVVQWMPIFKVGLMDSRSNLIHVERRCVFPAEGFRAAFAYRLLPLSTM